MRTYRMSMQGWLGRTRDARKVIKVPAVWAGRHAPLTNRADWTSQRSISSAHRPCEWIEKAGWGELVTREKKMQFLPFGLAATHASRAGGSTGYFGRESMLGIYIEGPSRAVRYLGRAARPGCPYPRGIHFSRGHELCHVPRTWWVWVVRGTRRIGERSRVGKRSTGESA